MGLRNDFTVRFPKCHPVTISTIRLTENDDSEAYDSILHCIGHYLGRNRVKKGFHR